jgi:transposase
MPHDQPPWTALHQKPQRWFKAGVFEAMLAFTVLMPHRFALLMVHYPNKLSVSSQHPHRIISASLGMLC